MKRRFLILVLAVLTVGLLGSCKKINERIDGLDQRVDNIEQEKIASIQNQIAAINSSIADLGTIRKDILDLQVAVGAKGEDISELQVADKAIVQRLSELQAADAAIEKRIDELKAVVGDLSRYAEKDWATATFATLEQLNATNTELSALKEIVDGLSGIIDEKIAKVKSSLSASISSAIRSVNASISELEGRVAALEERIQSVTLVQAYSDGSVRDEDGKLSLELVVSPASAAIGLTASDFKVLVTEVTTVTKASSITTLPVESVVNNDDGNLTLTVDISGCTPTTGHSLAVAVNVVKGKSDLTTEFVTVSAAPASPTFKAVYNTKDDVNTLTFYYDAIGHSGEGIIVYQNGTDNGLFDDSKNQYLQWGYNDKRKSIKSVVIDASVKDYKGLTSTAYMFYAMINATDISGAENLDVSNVTDMSYMFSNFGKTSITKVPNVSGWNTGKAEDMSNMFNSYGMSSANLTEIPEVSNWNTGSVTNMSQMFSNYGSSSTVLDKVPDVKLWNTGKVVNMSLMFSNYGQKSTKLTEVPDVSKWNTGSVTNMSQMFEYYGKTSKELANLPEVTLWNTENVEDWSSIFNSYGSSSTALTKVPNVSGWKTNNVKEIDNMFNGYGSSSSNIDCVLDLSGWDLSKLSQGGSAFEFKPKTFNVTIPAKTGEIYNQGQKWSYGVYNFFIQPALKPGNGDERYSFTLAGVPADAITGVFSVSESKKVRFSRGNLWYGPKTTGASSTFNFETNQYDISSSWNESHVSNFYWSKTASSAYATTYDNAGSTTDVLFTNATETTPISDFTVNGVTGKYRTLSKDEWQYLFGTRTVNGGAGEGKSYSADITYGGKKGVVLYPDNYTGSVLSGTVTVLPEDVVFLPSTGYRDGGSIYEVSETTISCIYWTSTAEEYDKAYRMFFKWEGSTLSTAFNDNNSREWAVGIRLVTDVPAK